MLLRLLILLHVIGLAACSSQPSPLPVAQGLQAPELRQALQQVYQHWQGTPYQLGGMSRNGVDCSAFVYHAYRSAFAIDLPRTVTQQAASGRPVSVSRLYPGDLLVFQTGYKQQHIGIYTGNGQFIHASTSQGVTRSSLANPYWQAVFIQAVRHAQLNDGQF